MIPCDAHPADSNNLLHALRGPCTDPDCEIHTPIAADEMCPTNAAMFIAGAGLAVAMMREGMTDIAVQTEVFHRVGMLTIPAEDER